jgi:small subunit ribosomal protein S6
MTLPAPTYDLTLLLDPDAEEAARAKIVADARAAIEARGELERLDEWGTRPLSYPIERKRAADYYLLQFHASTPELLADLQRSLRITDGILRFRLIKLKPGVPPAPDLRASAPAGRGEAPSAPAPATPLAESSMVAVEAVVEVDVPADAQPSADAEAAGASAPPAHPEDGAAGDQAPMQQPPPAEQPEATDPAPAAVEPDADEAS